MTGGNLHALLDELRSILDGIDRSEFDEGGWWETSVGEEFGARKLADVEAAVTRAWLERDRPK